MQMWNILGVFPEVNIKIFNVTINIDHKHKNCTVPLVSYYSGFHYWHVLILVYLHSFLHYWYQFFMFYLMVNYVWHRGHVPYRDSKLTRILQPALGGNANTAIICNITLAQVWIKKKIIVGSSEFITSAVNFYKTFFSMVDTCWWDKKQFAVCEQS